MEFRLNDCIVFQSSINSIFHYKLSRCWCWLLENNELFNNNWLVITNKYVNMWVDFYNSVPDVIHFNILLSYVILILHILFLFHDTVSISMNIDILTNWLYNDWNCNWICPWNFFMAPYAKKYHQMIYWIQIKPNSSTFIRYNLSGTHVKR